MKTYRSTDIVTAERFFIDKKPWPKGVYDFNNEWRSSTNRYRLNLRKRGGGRDNLIEQGIDDGWVIITSVKDGKSEAMPYERFVKEFEEN